MPIAFILACLWALTACLAGMMPTRYHWSAAWALIATGIPLLGFVTMSMGPWWGLAVMAAGVSVLRWPLIRLAQTLRAGCRMPERDATPED